MKADTAILIVKCLLYALIGAGASVVSGLSQWANEGEWPPRIQWIIIIASAATASGTQVLSFLSGSYADWQKSRLDKNGNAPKITP